MNCKPGDLAVVVAKDKCISFHVGKIVRVNNWNPFTQAWMCTPDLKDTEGRFCDWADSALRPLRDNPGQDETLDWEPVPKKEFA